MKRREAKRVMMRVAACASNAKTYQRWGRPAIQRCDHQWFVGPENYCTDNRILREVNDGIELWINGKHGDQNGEGLGGLAVDANSAWKKKVNAVGIMADETRQKARRYEMCRRRNKM